MKHSSLATIIAVAAILLSTSAHSETLYRGKVYQVTADRIIEAQRLPCVYGPWQSATLTNGSTVISRSKTCQR